MTMHSDKEPRLIFPEDFNFSCIGCGRCCIDWNIHVERKAYERIISTSLFTSLKQELNGKSPFCEDQTEGTISTLRRSDGTCIFLTTEILCTIHKDVGYEAKPLGCRQFPFKLRFTPDGIFVGLSLYCESCQKNTGRPVETYRDEIISWLGEFDYGQMLDDWIPLNQKLSMSWNAYKMLENMLTYSISDVSNIEEELLTFLVRSCLLVISFHQKGLTRLADEDVKREIEAIWRRPLVKDGIFNQLGLFYTMAIAGTIESYTGENARANTEAAMNGGILKSATFGKDIPMDRFFPYCQENPCLWRFPFIHRYISHLVFRKFLLGPEPILYNIAALFTSYGLLEFYMYLSAYQREKVTPEIEDMYFAYCIVEKSFSGHTRLMLPFFKTFADGFIEQLNKKI